MIEVLDEPLEGWHFLRDDRRLSYADGRLVIPGETLRVDGKIAIGRFGLHAATRAIAALEYAVGPIVEWVRLEPPVLFDGDVACSAARRSLWCADASRTLHEFACWCAEQALLHERQAGREPDERGWAAIAAKQRWLKAEIDDAALAAAWDAARAAAWDAARAAAWDAARDAARDAQNAELHRLLWLLAPAAIDPIPMQGAAIAKHK